MYIKDLVERYHSTGERDDPITDYYGEVLQIGDEIEIRVEEQAFNVGDRGIVADIYDNRIEVELLDKSYQDNVSPYNVEKM